MPFTIICNNKKCGKLQSPYIDPKTDKVFCSECDGEITTVTHFAKVQMKSLKQYRQHTGKSFAVKCSNCSNEDRPQKKEGSYICTKCGQPLNISHAFKVTLDAYLGSAGKEI